MGQVCCKAEVVPPIVFDDLSDNHRVQVVDSSMPSTGPARILTGVKGSGPEQFEALPPIVLFDLEALRKLGRFPRSPEDKHLQTKLDDIDRNKSVFIFVSHCWLRGWSGAADWDGRPHPDTKNQDKLKLIIEAADKIMKAMAKEGMKCYLWLDFGCIDQDASACLELKMLDKIIGACDVILTPIFDSDTEFIWWKDIQKKGISSWYKQYGSPGWNQGDHAYLNRSWCRVEMYFAANVPLNPSDAIRVLKFKAALLSSIQAGHRPHILYGSCEQKTNRPVIVLPPLSNSYFDEFNPIEGKLTKESDRENVRQLVEELLPYMTRIQAGYEGEMKDGKQHGRGTKRYANGAVYEGEFKDGKKHGRGTERYATGNVYEGEFKDDQKHGRGTYRYASGNVYEGDWKDGKKHGRGTM